MILLVWLQRPSPRNGRVESAEGKRLVFACCWGTVRGLPWGAGGGERCWGPGGAAAEHREAQHMPGQLYPLSTL